MKLVISSSVLQFTRHYSTCIEGCMRFSAIAEPQNLRFDLSLIQFAFEAERISSVIVQPSVVSRPINYSEILPQHGINSKLSYLSLIYRFSSMNLSVALSSTFTYSLTSSRVLQVFDPVVELWLYKENATSNSISQVVNTVSKSYAVAFYTQL